MLLPLDCLLHIASAAEHHKTPTEYHKTPTDHLKTPQNTNRTPTSGHRKQHKTNLPQQPHAAQSLRELHSAAPQTASRISPISPAAQHASANCMRHNDALCVSSPGLPVCDCLLQQRALQSVHQFHSCNQHRSVSGSSEFWLGLHDTRQLTQARVVAGVGEIEPVPATSQYDHNHRACASHKSIVHQPQSLC